MTLTVALEGFSDSDRAAAEDEGLHLDSRLRDELQEVMGRVARGGTDQGTGRGWAAAAALLVCTGVLGGVAECIQSGWVFLPLVFVPSLVILRQDPRVQVDETATQALWTRLSAALDLCAWIRVLPEPGAE